MISLFRSKLPQIAGLAILLHVPAALAIPAPLTRQQLDDAGNESIRSFQNWSELQLIHQFAKLTTDWEVAFRQLTDELGTLGVGMTQAASDLEALDDGAAPRNINLGALIQVAYKIAVLRENAKELEANLTTTREAWTNRCSRDRLDLVVGSTLSRSMQMFEPFQIHMDGSVAGFALCGTVGVTASTSGSTVSLAPMGQSSSSQMSGYCAGAGTVGMIGGLAGGAALATSAGLIAGSLAAGAAAGGVGIVGALVAVAIVSAIDFANYASTMGHFYRDYGEVRTRVQQAWAGLRARLTAQSAGHCASWMGAISSRESDPVFLRLAAQTRVTRSGIEALESRKNQIFAGLRERYVRYLQELPVRMMQWQQNHVEYLRTLIAQLRHDDTESDSYVLNQLQPALTAVVAERRTGNGTPLLLLQAESRLWDAIINGDVVYRKQPGWSFPMSGDPDTYGLRSGWDAWIEDTRGSLR